MVLSNLLFFQVHSLGREALGPKRRDASVCVLCERSRWRACTAVVAGDAQKQFWVIPSSPNTAEDITVGKMHGVRHFLFKNRDESEREYDGLDYRYFIEGGSILRSKGEGRDVGDTSELCGIYMNIENGRDLDGLMEKIDARLSDDNASGKAMVVANFVGDWRVIPAENLVALNAHAEKEASKNRDVDILGVTKGVEDARVMLSALESGLGGVVLEGGSEQDIIDFAELQKECLQAQGSLDLIEGTIRAVKVLGIGDRLCVDTCSILGENEGMLVGSTAGALGLVLAESVEVGYVPKRSFRVNAGPVSSYVLCEDGKTKYLEELSAGDVVVIVNQEGKTRSAVVGRVKIESRPLMLIEVEVDGEVGKIALQNAETVRMATNDKEWVSISKLKEGDAVLIRLETAARHMGLAIKERIVER
eukprot:Plantae.Rhodophyta-Hildenbrandia_rubra.ctg3646.p1 GENE.Plantae.Rhodophyta-Hildenbrandia_rubra.ctg3646~~Plantae.Rhodophyta-Hildenbrandia_rubra.ctg3646.p1  ORF type:complete len:419 (+),score=75.87 Plantae.Rhodophyta-Hildenbrandia_rubra.ctg3646:3912-5168(+)